MEDCRFGSSQLQQSLMEAVQANDRADDQRHAGERGEVHPTDAQGEEAQGAEETV